MKIDLGKIRIEVSALALLRGYRFIRRFLKRKKLAIKIVRKGCPKCGENLEVSAIFSVCVDFGNGCDYISIKGLKISANVPK